MRWTPDQAQQLAQSYFAMQQAWGWQVSPKMRTALVFAGVLLGQLRGKAAVMRERMMAARRAAAEAGALVPARQAPNMPPTHQQPRAPGNGRDHPGEDLVRAAGGEGIILTPGSVPDAGKIDFGAP